MAGNAAVRPLHRLPLGLPASSGPTTKDTLLSSKDCVQPGGALISAVLRQAVLPIPLLLYGRRRVH